MEAPRSKPTRYSPYPIRDYFKVFECSREFASNAARKTPPPRNSMAWFDLKCGMISSEEKVKSVNLPPTIARMMAADARKRSHAAAKKLNDSKGPPSAPWVTAPNTAQPLMSIHVPKPSRPAFFNATINPISGTVQLPEQQNNGNGWRTMDEEKMLSVLTQVNLIARKIAEVLGTTVLARIERRKCDNAMCLFTYFKDFPWAIIGGGAVIEEEFTNKPPPPHKIYESWRIQMFQSLQVFLPPPLHSKMKRHIDKNSNMDWNMRLIASEDFREIVKRVTELRRNQPFERLWTTDPIDYDHRDTELVTIRSTIIRQIETEVRSFWTYERIGTHLKMNT